MIISGKGWVDASARLDSPLPIWPTSRGLAVEWARTVGTDGVGETYLAMDVHCGTHVDAPAHLIDGGGTVDSLRLDAFVGDVLVADASGLAAIDDKAVDRLVPIGQSRVLFRTDNSARELMRRREFAPDFVALTVSGARALASRAGLMLVGNDYLSIQPFGGDNESHLALMRRGIAILEGLDLTDVQPGEYELLAVPLRLDETEAAPLRALLRPKRLVNV